MTQIIKVSYTYYKINGYVKFYRNDVVIHQKSIFAKRLSLSKNSVGIQYGLLYIGICLSIEMNY